MLKPFHSQDTKDYSGTFDSSKVCIGGWEYSSNGMDVNFTPDMPTHAVVWMRPTFTIIDLVPEGYALVDAYACWPEGLNRVVDETGKIIQRPPRGTFVLAPLPKEL